MKIRKLFILTLAMFLIIAQTAPAFAEQAKISPFVKYEEIGTYKLSRYDVINIAVLDEKNAVNKQAISKTRMCKYAVRKATGF